MLRYKYVQIALTCTLVVLVERVHPFTIVDKLSPTTGTRKSEICCANVQHRMKSVRSNSALFDIDPLQSPSKASLPTAPRTMRKKKNLQTFPRYLEVECWKQPNLRGLESVLQAVADACKQINRIVQRAQTDELYGVAVDSDGNPLEENIQGEAQQKLDVLCNTIIIRAFCGSGRDGGIHSVASEEEDEIRCCADVMVRYLPLRN